MAAIDIRVASPPSHRPDTMIAGGAEMIAELHCGRLTITGDPRKAVAGADAVYTAAWSHFGGEARVPRLYAYQVHPGPMDRVRHSAVFMHCLPARRGEEVSSHVIDGRRSVVWQQAANRVPVEEVLLYALVSGCEQRASE